MCRLNEGENMNEPDAQTAPNYVTCLCQHCSGKIEFDANQLDPSENTTVPCPHCELETKLFVPEQKVPPVVLDEDFHLRNAREVELEEEVRKGRKAAIANFMADQGSYHLGSENYVEAVKCFKIAAEEKNSIAQYHLGVCYSNGFGVAKDHDEAAKWFRLAANQGDPEAQLNLGVAYWKGEGVPKNQFEAVKWSRLAAEQGQSEAQCNLGTAYRLGEGVKKDMVEAMKWYRMAAMQGHSKAQYILGLAYGQGEGVPQNYVEAYKWVNLAAATGLDEAKEVRETLAQQMTPLQIEEGQRLASRETFKIQNPANHTVQERQARAAIPSEVRREVWRRDGGACVKCGSRRNLEYDHIVPVSKGGSNTVRNIELLCETCNRSKSASIQ
jgi:tetratricopeptide (TPR) repeat protein